MKTIVIGRVSNKKYYMDKKCELIISWYTSGSDSSNSTSEFVYDDDSNYIGQLQSKLIEDKEVILSESYGIPKILSVNDYIHISDNEYIIKKVKFGVDGIMYYYVDIEIVDEESKTLALRQIELREAYLKGRKSIEDAYKEKKENQDKTIKLLSAVNQTPKKIKNKRKKK
ncbi:hypothetical protein [Paenibacillus odorifer]|uniref:hypothetical protein n=1 Tax=Paenibacillus odorifer TaxID=189426 RepID=UPI0015C2ECED|nr:hypothetical protein [Paenibacillus odorifer]